MGKFSCSILNFSVKFRKKHYSMIENSTGSCRDCLTRIPYATFIATVLCFIGIGVFCGTVYRGATLANLILLDVFHVQVEW